MAKSVRGIYKDGKIRLPTKELPEVDGELMHNHFIELV